MKSDQYIIDAIIRQQITSRGGGVEIDLGKIDVAFAGEKMSAYQNYLGGGMLGRVMSNDTIRHTGDVKKQIQYSNLYDYLDQIAEDLRRYYFHLTNPDEDTWEHQTFDQNQRMSGSAY